MQNTTIPRADDREQTQQTQAICVESDNECYCDSPNRNRQKLRWEDVWAGQSTYAQRPDIDRFWASVSRSDGCWVCGLRRGDKYGHAQFTFRVDGKQYHCYAHRFVWLLTYGDPTGTFVLHSCDNGPCVRPEHLFLGDQDANMKDAASKARLTGPLKLSDAAYLEIITEPFLYGSGRALAAKHGVDQVSISRIRHGLQGNAWRRRHGHLPSSAPVYATASHATNNSFPEVC